MHFGAEGVKQRMDRKINQDLRQQHYTFRRGPTWGGAHEYLIHVLGYGREGKAQERPFSGTICACRFLEEKRSFKIVGLPSSTGSVR